MDFDYITCKVEISDDGPNIDQLGNRFMVVPESVLWCNEPDWAKFCGCGDPIAVQEMMLSYLESLDGEWIDRKKAEKRWGEWAYLLLGYMADSLGWTEHGGSVEGAWLTDLGRMNLAALRWFVRQALLPDPD